ncbi:MAG: helix-turn-helix domain-containing protein [Bdellovibrionales bacterium]|jgi:excisionase family DNA binding protein|nr:helix-turn-helix domain-containing protein [Bdellovibrionales bacterium]
MENLKGKKIFTAAEAAQYLSITIQTLYNMKHKGEIKGFNMGGKKKGKLFFFEEHLLEAAMGRVG